MHRYANMAIGLQRGPSVFQAVPELPPAERAAVLEQECGDDADSQGEVCLVSCANSSLPPKFRRSLIAIETVQTA
jgi:hypothetical protein